MPLLQQEPEQTSRRTAEQQIQQAELRSNAACEMAELLRRKGNRWTEQERQKYLAHALRRIYSG